MNIEIEIFFTQEIRGCFGKTDLILDLIGCVIDKR